MAGGTSLSDSAVYRVVAYVCVSFAAVQGWRFGAGARAGPQAGPADVRFCLLLIAIRSVVGARLHWGCISVGAKGSVGSELCHSLGLSQAGNGSRLRFWVGLLPPVG